MTNFLYWLFSSILLIIISPLYSEAALYHKYETAHFVVQYHEADTKFSRYVIEESEMIRAKIISDVGYNLTEKTKIILAPSIEEFQQVQPHNEKIPLWAAAAAYPDHNLIIIRSPSAVKGGHLDYRSVFIHEFTHVVLGRALQHQDVPTFLAEGIAMYESSEWHFSRMATLTKAALTDHMIPLQKLTDQFPEDPNDAELAYAESFMFISFLINRFGRESFHQFIKDYSNSRNLKQSLQRMTGMHPITLEGEWIDYMKVRVSWIPLITSATTFWFILTLVFIYGYYRNKRRAEATLKKWEEEEK